MENKTIRLSEPESEQYQYRFPFHIGQRVKTKSDKRKGIVNDAKLEKSSDGWVGDAVYVIQFDDEEVAELLTDELEEA